MVQNSASVRPRSRGLLALAGALLTLLVLTLAPAGAQAQAPPSLIGTSGGHSCAVQPDGTPRCWGDNTYGQRTIPEGTGAVTQIAVGRYHTCVIKVDRTPACWGWNNLQQTTLPAGIGTVRAIAAGYRFSCAIKTSGAVVCWGDNTYGQLFVPSTLGVAKQISVGRFHACAIKADDTAACWGYNSNSQVPVPSTVGTVKQINAGQGNTCAVKTDGTGVCWGNTSDNLTVPAGVGPVREIAAGYQHACAVKVDGTVACWGSNLVGQTNVPGTLGAVSQLYAAPLGDCVVKADGTPACWGDNGYGQNTVPAGVTVGQTNAALAPTDVTASGATLQGRVTTAATGYQFLYRRLGETAWSATPHTAVDSAGAVSTAVTGLDPMATYYVKVRAYPLVDGRYTYSATTSFTTAVAAPAAADVAVNPVTDLTVTGATLGVTVDTHGAPVSGVVEWGAAAGDYTRSAALYADGPAGARVLSRALPTQFSPGTEYHYRVTVTNAGGATTTADQTFTTPAPGGPTATLQGVDPLSFTTATINAIVDLHGAALTSGTVQWGTTTSYGRSLPLLPGGATVGGRTYTRPLQSLKPGTLYHYRVVVTTTAGTYDSGDQTFTTEATEPV